MSNATLKEIKKSYSPTFSAKVLKASQNELNQYERSGKPEFLKHRIADRGQDLKSGVLKPNPEFNWLLHRLLVCGCTLSYIAHNIPCSPGHMTRLWRGTRTVNHRHIAVCNKLLMEQYLTQLRHVIDDSFANAKIISTSHARGSHISESKEAIRNASIAMLTDALLYGKANFLLPEKEPGAIIELTKGVFVFVANDDIHMAHECDAMANFLQSKARMLRSGREQYENVDDRFQHELSKLVLPTQHKYESG